ncbi:PREDICTED: THO complex subunit 7 homolog isoform X1 [Dufourea novaeangliae]|uniref:THO complex subunit 7 homolog isoform X1 n=1 Tax=Dufourea novaeangliae TaxID=178035 RepID=UPI0007678AA3|nr:PREDICTED: THO complex subunit 7 homolog isoform X1 [Dufourea novaeangliae]
MITCYEVRIYLGICCFFLEEVIRRRLLIDGDGTGDDRRINMLLKSFIKWVNNPDVDNTLHERMLSQLAQCEFAQKKSRLVSNMSQDELKSYEKLSKEIEIQIEEAKKDIERTKAELQEAKRVRKNRIEYDVLAKVINEQPDRVETNLKLATLREELGRLKEKSEQLEHKLEMRRKQFHVLISSIHSLQGMLDECDEEIMDVSLENYEDTNNPSVPSKSEES